MLQHVYCTSPRIHSVGLRDARFVMRDKIRFTFHVSRFTFHVSQNSVSAKSLKGADS